MIILRTKHFVDPDKKFVTPIPFPLPPGGEDLPFVVAVIGENVPKGHPPTKFMKERDKMIKLGGKAWKNNYSPVLKSIKQGYVYEDRLPGERTHYYPDDSEKGKRYYVSKDINPNDRLMYDVYAPEIRKDKNGNDIVVQEVHLLHCSGHIDRKGKRFSETQ